MYSHVWCPQHYPLYHLFLSAIASIFVGFVLIDLHRIQNGNLIRNSRWNSMLNWMLLMLCGNLWFWLNMMKPILFKKKHILPFVVFTKLSDVASIFVGFPASRSLVVCELFCRSLFGLLAFFFWPFIVLSVLLRFTASGYLLWYLQTFLDIFLLTIVFY